MARHRSSKPSGAISDQDQPQYDPEPPYYSEVAVSDVFFFFFFLFFFIFQKVSYTNFNNTLTMNEGQKENISIFK